MNRAEIDEGRSGSWRRWLLGLALGVLVAAWAVPASRAIARQQLVWFFTPPGLEMDAGAASRAAAQHPGDFPLQLARALGETRDAATLRAALAPYAGLPSARANFLRIASKRLLDLHRDEESLLSGDAPRNSSAARTPPLPADLSAMEEDATAGERLDPDNGFFPMMLAGILFAGHRDAEALAAVHRAGAARDWEDYSADEATGKRRLGDLTGREDAIHHAAWTFAVLLPHYTVMRSACRMALYHAIQAEAAGRREEGLAIRRDVALYAGVIRSRAHPLMGSLMAIAIQQLVTARPGGTPPARSAPGESPELRHQARVAAYTSYLEGIGHPEEAARVRKEDEAARQVRAVAAQVSSDAFYESSLGGVIGWWIGALILLSNILWMLALGILAALLARLPFARAGDAMPGAARCAIASALLTAAAGGALYASHMLTPAMLGLLFLLPVGLWALSGRSHSLPRFLGVAAASLLALAAAGFSFYATTRGILSLLGVDHALFGFDQAENQPAGAAVAAWARAGATPLVLSASAIVPALVAVVLGIASLILRVPLAAGLVRAFRGAALPVACVLVMGYGALTLATTHPEARLNHALEQMICHEGQYQAERAGLPWPGAIR